MSRFAADPGAQKELLRAYLDPWRALTGLADLEAAFDLSQKLLPCYHALAYYWIVQNTEPTALWELGGGVAYYLKQLLLAFGHPDPETPTPTDNGAMT